MRPAVVATPILFTDVRFTLVKHILVTTKALNRHCFFKIFLFDINAWIWHWFFHRFWITLASILGPIFHHFSWHCPFLDMLFLHRFLEWFLNGFWIDFVMHLGPARRLRGGPANWLSGVLGALARLGAACWASWGRSWAVLVILGTSWDDLNGFYFNVGMIFTPHLHDFTAIQGIINSPQ